MPKLIRILKVGDKRSQRGTFCLGMGQYTLFHKSLDEDFMFQLTKDEAESLSRCKNFTLNIKYLPYAFTEQGIYMLMTVLKGTLATQQSKTPGCRYEMA